MQTGAVFSEFRTLIETDVAKLIKESATKSCIFAPIPTWILRQWLNVLLPLITQIINLSLSTGVMPDNLKQAILISLLKKALLDPEILNRFRPISNLAYISKLVEQSVALQVTDHAIEHGLYPHQSADKHNHSTETVLLKVHIDLMCAIDQGKAVVLVLLDLSTAFDDTVNHGILLHRLHTYLDFRGVALDWF